MSLTSRSSSTIEIFYSYSHKDEKLRNELETHLSLLKREGLISSWHDRKIGAGEEWFGQIDIYLNTAQIILLLISPDFIASDYCYDNELKRAMERHEAGEAHVIPIILRPVHWKDAPIGKLQALPKDGKPVISRSWHNRDEAFLEVVTGIRDVIKGLRANLSYTSSPRSIIGIPPPTDPSTIQQREQAVKEVYTKLSQPIITAIVLTGIGGLGKSTLAALVYRYSEKQRLVGRGTFNTEAIWLQIDDAVTMTDMGVTLLDALGKPLSEFTQLEPSNQALALFHALKTAEKTLLIVLDQFENLLDWQTGRAHTNRPGIGEWLTLLNSEVSRCRVLLTSRSRPQGTHFFPQTHMQEYPVQGLNFDEGIDLLRKQGVTEAQATEDDLHTAVDCCEGHALALTLLAAILRDHNLRLNTLLKDPTFEQLWTGDIASNLLDYIYTQQLDEPQRKLLLSFSVFREAVPLAAAETLIDFGIQTSRAPIQSALKGLLAQHLLQATGEGRYQLHVIVCNYAQNHFEKDDVQANQQALQTTHAEAAQYYLQKAAKICPPRDKRRSINDVQPLIEAIWQYCQAKQWQEAYDLMQREGILHDLKVWGTNAILLELCQLLDKEKLEISQAASIDYYLGWVCFDLGQHKQALKHYEEALLKYRQVGDRRGESITFNGLGATYYALGRKEMELPLYKHALQISREVGDRSIEGISLNNLGYTYKVLGEFEEAQRYFEEALVIRKEIRDYDGECRTLNGLGSIYGAQGKKMEALKCYREALRISRDIVGNRYWEGIILQSIGKHYVKDDQYDAALASFLLAKNIFDEIQSPVHNKVQEKINSLRRKVGEKQFVTLFAQIEQQALQNLKLALNERLKE